MRTFAEKNTWLLPAVISAVLYAGICALSGTVSLQTLMLNLTQMSFLIVLGMGQMAVITSGAGAIDLSITNNVALAAYIVCFFTYSDLVATPLAVVITLAIVMLVGLVNGLITVYLRIPAIITTLAVSYVVYSALLLMMPNIIGTPAKDLTAFARSQVLGLSSMTVLALVMALLFWVLMFKTKYGFNLRAIGQNHLIGKLSNIKVNRTLLLTFVLSALCAGIGGILICSYTGGAYVDMGSSYHLPTIASIVIGGTLISGGKCSVLGAVCGAMMMTFLNTLLGVSGLSIGMQQLLQGAILLLILAASISEKR